MIATIQANALNIPLANETVDCVITSPPYYRLRDYGSGGQIGVEDTVAEYVANMMAVFAEVWRVAKPTATVWLNLGDSYAQVASKPKTPDTHWMGVGLMPTRFLTDGLKEKDLIGIPWRVALALQEYGYWIRNEVIWDKPNAKPEPYKDRLTRSHEHIFLLTKTGKDYYFDYEAVLEPYTVPLDRWGGDKLKANGMSLWDMGTGQNIYRERDMRPDKRGRRRRDVWRINTVTGKFGGQHFATFPPRLVELCLLAGCPPKGMVLDPFAGSGTVLDVAGMLGRDAVGLDLSDEYARLSNRRVNDGLQAVLL